MEQDRAKFNNLYWRLSDVWQLVLGNLSSGASNDKYTVGCNIMSSSYGAPGKKKEERNNEEKNGSNKIY